MVESVRSVERAKRVMESADKTVCLSPLADGRVSGVAACVMTPAESLSLESSILFQRTAERRRNNLYCERWGSNHIDERDHESALVLWIPLVRLGISPCLLVETCGRTTGACVDVDRFDNNSTDRMCA